MWIYDGPDFELARNSRGLTAFLHQFSSQWLSYAIWPWYNRSQCEFWTVSQLVCIFWIIYRSLTCFSSRRWKSWGTMWIKQSKGTTLLVNTLWVVKDLSKTWDQRTRAALISWRISTRVTMLKFVSIVGTQLPFSAPLLSHLVDKRTQINVRTGSWLTLIFRGKGKKKLFDIYWLRKVIVIEARCMYLMWREFALFCG